MDELPSNASVLTQTAFERAAVSHNLLWCVLIIINGDYGNIFQMPCTGSLLRPDLVLTTLSCLLAGDNRLADPGNIDIFVRNNQILMARKIYTSSKYGKDYDLALVWCTPAYIDDFPTLPSEEFWLQPSCSVSGYGLDGPVKTRNFNTKSFSKSQVWLCNRYSVREDRLCLHLNTLMPCRGDVGAPLLCNGTLHGIYNPVAVPTQETCIDRYATHFSPLHSAVDWIRHVEESVDSVPLAWISPWVNIVAAIAVLAAISFIYLSIMEYVKRRYSQFF